MWVCLNIENIPRKWQCSCGICSQEMVFVEVFCIRFMVVSYSNGQKLDWMGQRNPAAVDVPSGARFTPREGSVPCCGERCDLVMG